MKVLASAPRPPATPTSQPFGQLLAEARAALRSPAVPPGLVRRDLNATAVRVQQAVLTRARAEAHVEAARLRDVRCEALGTSESSAEGRSEQVTGQARGTEERLVELIVRELSAEPPRPVLGPTPFERSATSGELPVERRAVVAAALIEKIDRFVRSGRPGLELTLNNSLAARVELERVGPREVAVKLVGRDGPPSPESVSQVREALRARGLKVAALSVE